jgi:organic radical activating enzyme
MKAKIMEIFPSLQGEGPYTGARQIFIRFWGCALQCGWCDTRPQAQTDPTGTPRYEELTVAQVVRKIQAWDGPFHSVSLTGGEPLQHKDFIREMVPKLKERGFSIFLETNGILCDALAGLLAGIDIISMDFKLPSSLGTQGKDHWKAHETFLAIAARKEVYVKAVICGSTCEKDIRKAMSVIRSVNPAICFVLQPNTRELSPALIDKCQHFQYQCLKELRDVRVIPQMHKFLRIP